MSTLAQPHTGPVLPDTSTRVERRYKMNMPPPPISKTAPIAVRNAHGLFDSIRFNIEEVLNKEAALRANPHLSVAGRQREFKTFVNDTIRIIEKTRDILLTPLYKELERQNTELPKLKQRESLSDAMSARELELRATLRHLNIVELNSVVQQAIKDGDELTIHAIVNDPNLKHPKLKPLVQPERVHQYVDEFLRARAPEAFKQRDEAEALYVAAAKAAQDVVTEFNEHKMAKFVAPPVDYRVNQLPLKV